MLKSQNQNKKKFKVLTDTQDPKLQGLIVLISIDEKIGFGSYGEVYIAYLIDKTKQQQNPEVLAIKQIKKIKSQKIESSIEHEKQILEKIAKNNNIVNPIKMLIESKNHFYILMEYCNGKSLSHIRDKKLAANKNFTDEQIYEIIYQTAKGYQSLKNQQIIHRDLKPDNLLTHEGIIKISDFGLAKHQSSEQDLKNQQFAGSPFFSAPELCIGQCSEKSDMYSLGLTAFCLSSKHQISPHPYLSKVTEEDIKRYKENQLQLLQDIQQDPLKRLIWPPYPQRPKELTDIIQSMCEIDPNKRISWEELLNKTEIKNAEKSKSFIQYAEKYNCPISQQIISLIQQNAMGLSQFKQSEVDIEHLNKQQSDESDGFQEVSEDFVDNDEWIDEHFFNNQLQEEINKFETTLDFQKFKEILFIIYESREVLFQFRTQIDKLLNTVIKLLRNNKISQQNEIEQNIFNIILAKSIYATNVLLNKYLYTDILFLKFEINSDDKKQFQNSQVMAEIRKNCETELQNFNEHIQQIINQHPRCNISANKFISKYFEGEYELLAEIKDSYLTFFGNYENLNYHCDSTNKRELVLIMLDLIESYNFIQNNQQCSLLFDPRKQENYSMIIQNKIQGIYLQQEIELVKTLIIELKILNIDLEGF